MTAAGPLDRAGLSQRQQDQIRAELTGSEELLWVGTNTRPRHFAARLILALLVVGVVMPPVLSTLMGLVWGLLALASDGPGQFGWAFVWGFWLTAGFFLAMVATPVGLAVFLPTVAVFVLAGWAYWRPRLYAVTTRRAIVWAPGWGKPTGPPAAQSFYPRQLETMRRVERRDGRGNLIFGPGRLTGFLEIAEVRKVEQLVRESLLGREGREKEGKQETS